MEGMEANFVSNEHSSIRPNSTDGEEKVLKDDFYSNDRIQCGESSVHFHDRDYVEKIKELHVYLDTVRKIVKPGCSQEVLNMTLASMSMIVERLNVISSGTHPRASL